MMEKENVIDHTEAKRLDAAVAEWETCSEVYSDFAPIRDFLMKRGFDGVLYENKYEIIPGERDPEGKDSWIAFWPQQVKSAIGNAGGYSDDDPRIWY
jgi:hypothetical protein